MTKEEKEKLQDKVSTECNEYVYFSQSREEVQLDGCFTKAELLRIASALDDEQEPDEEALRGYQEPR